MQKNSREPTASIFLSKMSMEETKGFTFELCHLQLPQTLQKKKTHPNIPRNCLHISPTPNMYTVKFPRKKKRRQEKFSLPTFILQRQRASTRMTSASSAVSEYAAAIFTRLDFKKLFEYLCCTCILFSCNCAVNFASRSDGVLQIRTWAVPSRHLLCFIPE